MKYWGEHSDSHIRLWESEIYAQYIPIKPSITDEGYRGDKLQPSEILFLGTCDVMSNLPDGNARWPALLHRHYEAQPFLPIGTVGSGLASMVRRLYSYIQNHGAPKMVYMTIPRFDSGEYVNSSGKCYSVSSRKGTATFLKAAKFITDDEYDIWLAQIDANRHLQNIHNNQYILEERFSFIEALCKAHTIRLKWTFNPSDAGIVMLYKNVSIFESISPFMKSSFVGLVDVKDHERDRSIGPLTHNEIYQKFMNPEGWDFERLTLQAENNFKWLQDRYGDNLINRE